MHGCPGQQMLPRSAALAGLLVFFTACGGAEEGGPPAALPPETGDPDPSGDSGAYFDPGGMPQDTGYNQSPEMTLAITHLGVWNQTPVGGPYTAMTGELTIEELVDGRPDQVWCRATFALTGLAVAADGCSTCDAAYLVEFFLVSEGASEEELEEDPDLQLGGASQCFSPDIPSDGDRWHMGWSGVEGSLYFNYYDSGIWLPWYDGENTHDRVDFAWLTTAGFHMPEMED